MNKTKIAFALGACLLVGAAFAGPHGCPGPGPGCRPCRPCPPPHRYHHHDCWGRGGRNFWPGFVGGVVGGLVGTAVAQPSTVVVAQPATVVATPVVTQPVVVQPTVVQTTTVAQPATTVQNVWVEGRYIDQVQANGTVLRTWQPGHYEQRAVVVQ